MDSVNGYMRYRGFPLHHLDAFAPLHSRTPQGHGIYVDGRNVVYDACYLEPLLVLEDVLQKRGLAS